MARPARIITDELILQVATLVRVGVPKEIAARAIGVTRDTLYKWAEKGRGGDKRYTKFAEAIDKADAECDVVLIKCVTQAALKGDWRAAQWELSKKHLERFGDVTRLEHTGKNGGPIEGAVKGGLTDEAAEFIRRKVLGLDETK